MVSGLQYDTSMAKLQLLELERAVGHLISPKLGDSSTILRLQNRKLKDQIEHDS